MARDDVYSLQNIRLSVGLSTIIGISTLPYSNAVVIQQVSGSTLEIGGASLTWGQGFIYPGTPISFNCAGSFYLAATGSTAIVNCLFGLYEQNK